jgi:hypothetical protein
MASSTAASSSSTAASSSSTAASSSSSTAASYYLKGEELYNNKHYQQAEIAFSNVSLFFRHL